MKKYKLLKNMPFAKAGEELYLKFSEDSEFFLVYKGTDKAYTAELNPEFIDNFDDWFEEDKEEKFSERIFYILADGGVDSIETVNYSNTKDNRKEYKEYKEKLKSVGNCFETREEAEKYLEFLKAKTVIKQDTKGFKPDWSNYEHKFCGVWDLLRNRLFFHPIMTSKQSTIYFRTKEDIEESFAKHPEEWKTYLTYEQ